MAYLNRRNPTPHTNSSQKNYSNTKYQGYKQPYTNCYRGSQNVQNDSEQLKDHGPYPYAVNIEKITKDNDAFRTTLWTGEHLQLTLMSLLPGEDIGLEIHEDVDQFIRIEEGSGIVMMGDDKDMPSFQQAVSADYAFIIPAGTWHNLVNVGSTPLKLYSIYAPPQHPFGTIHETKAIAEEAEDHH
ncbi:cupin domain-containing protein [Cellulosilyticum sp. I15G10I2]|uniref:cupin domain-containing protein n=1 Tax=Cellulosilyticum sp. I15G10I2 TaxID=1892843 RepID=UPI00085C661C|nr:cupin domain-containing protein [Cellulosilyticum sp. I15G10I2]